MRLRPRTREQAFRAIEGLKSPGQEAYLVKDFEGTEAIRICDDSHTISKTYGKKIESAEQTEVKEYQIIA